MLDIENPAQLEQYLKRSGHLGMDASIQVSVLQGGVSNKTMLVQSSSESWVIKQALEKLRVKADWFSDPKRIHREALGLRYVSDLIPSCLPKLIFEDTDHHVLAMSAVAHPHQNWKILLLSGMVQENHVSQFANILFNLHYQSYRHSSQLAPIFSDTTFFESLRLEPYYLYTAKHVPQAASFLQALVERTYSQKHTLVHGDYSPKNVLIYQGQLILLDYEVIHWGDPAFDVGFALTHFLSKAHYVKAKSQAFLDAAKLFWQTYHQKSDLYGSDFELRCVQHTLGCLLARVAGRSPLEYLSEEQKIRQRDISLSLLETHTIDHLIQNFEKGLLTNSV